MRKVLARYSRYALILLVALFIFLALIAGEWWHAYGTFWWWDDMVHALSGLVMGILGMVTFFFINDRPSERIKPFFVALFVFCFSMTVGALWEIFEFAMDVFFGTSMQGLSLTTPNLFGTARQSIGLRDTMSDLVDTGIGALAAGIFAYSSYKFKRATVIREMERLFFWNNH